MSYVVTFSIKGEGKGTFKTESKDIALALHQHLLAQYGKQLKRLSFHLECGGKMQLAHPVTPTRYQIRRKHG